MFWVVVALLYFVLAAVAPSVRKVMLPSTATTARARPRIQLRTFESLRSVARLPWDHSWSALGRPVALRNEGFPASCLFVVVLHPFIRSGTTRSLGLDAK